METIKIDSGDTRGEIGYSVGDNSLFIEIIDDSNKTKLSIWIPKQDALNITKKILMANNITKIKKSIDFE